MQPTVVFPCDSKGWLSCQRLQTSKRTALEFEIGGFIDSVTELGTIFHKTVKSPTTTGMTLEHGAGGGVEADCSFKEKIPTGKE